MPVKISLADVVAAVLVGWELDAVVVEFDFGTCAPQG